MFAATQAREQLLNENAKKKEKIAELQQFVSRFQQMLLRQNKQPLELNKLRRFS